MGEAVQAERREHLEIEQYGIGGEDYLALAGADRGEADEGRLQTEAAQALAA